MIKLPYSKAKRDALVSTLHTTHRMRIDARIKNHNEQNVHSLVHPVNRILGGSVQVDATADITRTAQLTVLDPDRKLKFESRSPSKGALFINRFLSLAYEVWVPDYTEWMSIPIFWGPITGYERDGLEVSIEAMGKESLLMDPYFVEGGGGGFTLPAGTKVQDAVIKVAQRMGERRFKVPPFRNEKLKRARIVKRKAEPWLVITGGKQVDHVKIRKPTHGGRHGKHNDKNKKHDHEVGPTGGLIRTLRRHYYAFFDGRGRLCVVPENRHPVYKFKEGRDFITRPNVTYDTSTARNVVVVLGGKKKGKNDNAYAKVRLNRHNPLSPGALNRNGQPREMIVWVEAENLKADKDCVELGQKVLRKVSKQHIDVSFDCLPVPFIEENDWVMIETNEAKWKVQIKEFTIPLTSGEAMTVGKRQRVRVHRRRHKGHGGAAGPGGPGSHGGHGGGGKHHGGGHHGGGGKHHGGGGKHHGGGHHGGGKHHHHHHHGREVG